MRPLQVSRYLRQFPSPCSPNWSLLRQADLNSLQTSLRDDRWQVSRYLRQFPSPCSPSLSLFSQARRNSSHCPPTRTPPGPISIDWEKAEIGITKRAAAAAAPSANFRIPFNIPHPPVAGELPVRIHHAGSGISFRPKCAKVNLRSSRRNRGAIAYDQLQPCVVQSWPPAISQRVVPANAGRDDPLKRRAYENSICDGPGRNRLSEARAIMVRVGIEDSAGSASGFVKGRIAFDANQRRLRRQDQPAALCHRGVIFPAEARRFCAVTEISTPPRNTGTVKYI